MSRTIVVGDVHGCADELRALLDEVGFSETDRLVMVGDLVIRGPKPRQVVELVRSVGGVSVRGNHEDRLLTFREHRRRDPSAAEQAARKFLRATAEELDEAAWSFLEAMPLWLDLDDHELRVVHAGLDPKRPIEAQDPHHLLTMRTLDEEGKPNARRDGGVLWGERYEGPPHVCFGHNAMGQPQLHPWATGLDTGCVYGGNLTALVLNAGETVPSSPPARRLVSVRAHATYHDIT